MHTLNTDSPEKHCTVLTQVCRDQMSISTNKQNIVTGQLSAAVARNMAEEQIFDNTHCRLLSVFILYIDSFNHDAGQLSAAASRYLIHYTNSEWNFIFILFLTSSYHSSAPMEQKCRNIQITSLLFFPEIIQSASITNKKLYSKHAPCYENTSYVNCCTHPPCAMCIVM